LLRSDHVTTADYGFFVKFIYDIYMASMALLSLYHVAGIGMAKLKGPITFTGTIDGFSFYHTADGIIIRRKWGPDKSRLKRDPAFKHIRQHSLEFGACAKAAKLLRMALAPVIKDVCDSRVTSRLNAVKNLDNVSEPGKRHVSEGFKDASAAGLLTGFSFNTGAGLEQLLRVPYRADAGKGEIRIPGFASRKGLNFPKGATHAIIQAGLAIVDFINKDQLFVSDDIIIKRGEPVPETVFTLMSKRKKQGIRVLVLKGRIYKKAKCNNVAGLLKYAVKHEIFII
jgi:hypothetical protein